MSKLEKFKQAIKNPPPERLSGIEYRTHFLMIIAYIFAGVMLFRSGFWFIIPIMAFSIMLSYVNGITAFNKHGVIKQFSKKEHPKDFIKDISPTRRRSKIIGYVYGEKVSWGIAITSVLIALFLIDPTISRWKLMMLYPSVIFLTYMVFYFVIMYWLSLPVYKQKMKRLEETRRKE